MQTNEWFYENGGAQVGPVTEAQLHGLIAAGTISQQTLVWRNGMADWKPLYSTGIIGGSAAVSPYAPPQFDSPLVTQTSGLAIASLVCGIVAIVTCLAYIPGISGLAAVICGHMGLGKIRKPNPALGGRGICIAGLVMGYLAIVIQLFIVLGAVWVFVKMSSDPSSPFHQLQWR